MYSYEQYFLVCRELGLSAAELDQAFRRAVFNLAAVNQEDHVKNFGFLMDREGRWSLAPARSRAVTGCRFLVPVPTG
jgi:serine/threonine-protein kinase HipA